MADILVVEDDPMLGRMWQRALTAAGHGVRLARTSADARREMMLRAAAVVLLDLNLGRESGLAFLTLAAYVNPDVRVLIATGTNLFPRGELFALSPNVAAVLRKPVAPSEVLALIEHHHPSGAHGPAAAMAS